MFGTLGQLADAVDKFNQELRAQFGREPDTEQVAAAFLTGFLDTAPEHLPLPAWQPRPDLHVRARATRIWGARVPNVQLGLLKCRPERWPPAHSGTRVPDMKLRAP
jgi:hypothetical protein